MYPGCFPAQTRVKLLKQDGQCSGYLGPRREEWGAVTVPSPPAAMLPEAGVVNPKMVDWKQQLLYGEEMRWSPWSYTEGRKGERVSHHGLKGL